MNKRVAETDRDPRYALDVKLAPGDRKATRYPIIGELPKSALSMLRAKLQAVLLRGHVGELTAEAVRETADRARRLVLTATSCPSVHAVPAAKEIAGLIAEYDAGGDGRTASAPSTNSIERNKLHIAENAGGFAVALDELGVELRYDLCGEGIQIKWNAAREFEPATERGIARLFELIACRMSFFDRPGQPRPAFFGTARGRNAMLAYLHEREVRGPPAA